MKICIVYELNNREFNNCILLQRELIRRGYKADLKNKTEDVNLFSTYDLTIVPNSYNSSDIEYYRKVFNIKNNKIIIYPCEQVSANHKLPGLFDNTEKNVVKKIPHLCWGNDYYQWIKSLGYKMDNSFITGAIHLDFSRPEFKKIYRTKDELAEKYGLPKEKKWVLFISDFVLSNNLRCEQFIKAKSYTREDLIKKRKFENKCFKSIIEWFYKFLNTHKDYIIIYRKHPVEILSKEIIKTACNLEGQMYLISDLNIKEWIFNCDKITTWNSTGVIESYAGSIKVGLLRPFAFEEKYGMKEYSFYEKYNSIKSYDQFVDCMENEIYEYSKETSEEINNLFSLLDKPAFMRVADAIDMLIHRELEMPWSTKSNNRIVFFIRHHILVKRVLKKIYQLGFRMFGDSNTKKTKGLLMMEEWKQSVIYKRKTKELIPKLDSIIQSFIKTK